MTGSIRGMTCDEMISYAKQHPNEYIVNTGFGEGEYIHYRNYYDIVEEREVEGFFDEENKPVEITCALSSVRTIYFSDGWYSKNDVRSAENCKYQVEIPGIGCCCKNRHYNGNGHYFPPCSCRNCPFLHPIYRDYRSHPLYAYEVRKEDNWYRPTW